MVESRRTPCYNCPFRKDTEAIALREGRLGGIVERLRDDDRQVFYCHKTTTGEKVTHPDGEEECQPSGYEKECMGAIAFMQKKYHTTSVNTRVNFLREKITPEHIKRAMELVISDVTDARTCE